jgi:hypothetical protein
MHEMFDAGLLLIVQSTEHLFLNFIRARMLPALELQETKVKEQGAAQ